MRQLDGAEEYSNQHAHIFMSATNQVKEAYVQQEAGHQFDGMTITHLLHMNFPRFLELELRWVDALIAAELHKKNRNEEDNLMFLFWSDKLSDFDFSCRRF